MKITEITFKARFDRGPLMAVLDVVFDQSLVIKDMRVIECTNGFLVAMPSRKVFIRCAYCNYKNDFGSFYCSECGALIPPQNSPDRVHCDIVHPVTRAFRVEIKQTILAAFEAERMRHSSNVVPNTAP